MDHASPGDPLLSLAAILLVGIGLGWLAKRVHLPSMTGQILAGVGLSHSGLALFGNASMAAMQPLTHFALALIGVTVGAHLNLRRLRNAGKRLSLLLLAESLITPFLVILVLRVFNGTSDTFAVLLGTLAISTAPATVVALVRETRSRGVFVKTLLAAVALNNVACIVLFESVRTAARLGFLEGMPMMVGSEPAIVPAVSAALARLGLAVALGAGGALIAHLLTLRTLQQERLATISAISILLTFGLASHLGVSALLACLVLGAVQSNLGLARDRLVDSVFVNFEPQIFCVFFTLAGMHLSLEAAREAGWMVPLFVLTRGLGKLAAAGTAMQLAGSTDRVRRNLGLALLPQAGLAIGLVILIDEDPAFTHLAETFVTVVVVAVAVNEVIGPVLTRLALLRSGEAGRDRPHLVDFLQEENITTSLRGESFDEVIETLTDLLIASHHLPGVDRDALLASIRDREALVSTCIGGGLAVPHGELPEGMPMVGVMGINRKGLDFDTPDESPVHCVVLLATPRGERDRHLQVLATLARTLGLDSAVQHQLYRAESAAHAYEILHGEEVEWFDYFLETAEPASN